jgi:hypothetical protein
MKKLITLLLLILPTLSFSQNCVRVDSVYSTAKLRELGSRDIKFGIKQIAEDLLSEKYCMSSTGKDIDIEVFYFGIPKKSLRVAGVEKSNQITQVGVRMHYDGQKYEGVGESETSITAVVVELTDGIPFSKMTVSTSLKKAIEICVLQMP